MKKKVKFLIKENKVGIAKKIVDILTYRNMNIVKMEIESPHISMELEGDNLAWKDFDKWIIENVDEIVEVKYIDMLDLERKASELQTAIDSMTVSLIAVGDNHKIRYFNKKAEKSFSISKKHKNTHINELLPKEIYNPNEIIEDKDDIEFSKIINNKRVSGLLDIRIVRNDYGKEIGSLLLLREMDEVRKTMQTISRPSMNTFDDIIGESLSIKRSKYIARSVSKTESNIMILGESGTGKELFARAIHINSNRSKGPFVAVNCSAVPDALMESEFFGYEKGAFTGANKSGKQGLFELATGGSLFLDEIGDLPIHLQAKILRAIQEKKIRRVGGDKEFDIDVRIISATHRNLEKMVEEGTFREDLYYRLNVVPVIIEPLRNRKEDILILSEYFIDIMKDDMNKEDIVLTEEVESQLMEYSWPGNVRELQNVIERAMIFADNKIEEKHLMVANKVNLKSENILYAENIDFPVNLPEILENIELEYIRKAKREYNSSREIGEALGISHTTVINKLKKM